MALRGTRPSLEDLDRVQDDPTSLPEIVDEYLVSEQFGEVVRDLHNDAFLQDAEIFEMEAVGPLEGESPARIAESVLQGPLRLIEHVVMHDEPYTEIVTADYWVVDHRAAAVWGTDYDPDGPAWQPVPISDNRPAAGILTDNGLYMRHESCGLNFNRGRAQMLSEALLCHDYLASNIDIDGSIDLSDPDEVATAVQNVGACMGCHQTLDPLASAMNGFFEAAFPDAPYSYPLPDVYDPTLETLWTEATGRAPGFFGQPVADMAELGASIADDPRFSQCTATRFYSYLAQVPREQVPQEVTTELQAVLQDNNFSARALVRHIVLSDAFRRSAATQAQDAALVGYKRARPFQIANLVLDLTGYEWQINLADLNDSEADDPLSVARSAFLGFEVLAGGHDSFFQTTPTLTVNATTTLFMRSLAINAASFVVDDDFARDADDRRLLRLIDADDTDPARVQAQLVWLFRRIHGEQLATDDPSVQDAYAIFAGANAQGGAPDRAWKATIAALLQDLSVVYY